MPIGGIPKWLVVVALTGSLQSTLIADCNGNGISDTEDLEKGISEDCNGSGIPDECEQSLLQLRQAKGGTKLTNLPRFLAAADLDADGHLDFVGATPQQRGAPRIFVYFNKIDTPGAKLRDFSRPALLSFARQKIAFLRGDSNVDGEVNIPDAIRTVAFLFRDGEPLDCTKAADANDDCQLSVTDSVWTLLHLFGDRALPKQSADCGVDPTPDTLGCDSVGPCF